MTRISTRYGWIPDLPDFRDRLFIPQFFIDPVDLPPVYSLPTHLPIFDQGFLGSCTANALSSAHMYAQMNRARLMAFFNPNDPAIAALPEVFTPSRLFIYFNERWIEHTILEDSGAMLRDGIKALDKWGVCSEDRGIDPEVNWPYDINQFTKRPAKSCYAEAEKHQIIKYERVPRRMNSLKLALKNGRPFVFGFTVYESFESEEVKRTGIVPMPRPREGMLGGHAVLAIGYDDNRQAFEVQNSWGIDWGLQGKFWLPYQYFLDDNLSADFWTISTVE